MAIKRGGPVDYQLNEIQFVVAQKLSAAPTGGGLVEGRYYYDTILHQFGYYNGTTWVYAGAAPPDATTSVKGIIQLAGLFDASSTAALPVLKADYVTAAMIATALKGGAAAGTEALRALGTTGTTAAAGNDARLSDSRAPSGAAGGDLTGTYPNPTFTEATVRAKLAAATADIAVNSHKITGVTDPTSAQDAATKFYVDAAIQGVHWDAARIASTANLGLTGLSAIDGITPVAGDVVLAKNQTTPAQNGLYVAAAGAWTRDPRMDTAAEVDGRVVVVEDGTQAGTLWITTSEVTTLGTDAITFTQFNSAADITATAPIVKTGNVLSLGVGTGLTVSGGLLIIAPTVVATKGHLTITGNGSATSFVANIGALNPPKSAPSVIEASTGDLVEVGVNYNGGTGDLTFTFGIAPANTVQFDAYWVQ